MRTKGGGGRQSWKDFVERAVCMPVVWESAGSACPVSGSLISCKVG